MLTKPYTILIGKNVDVNATGQADNALLIVAQANCAAGEIVLFDKNFTVIGGATDTMSTTDRVYLGQVTGEDIGYTTEDNSITITASKKILFSQPIIGTEIVSVVGKKYVAGAEQVTTFTDASSPVLVGTELVLRIVYKDLDEHPGQFAHTYHYTIPASATIGTINAALVALVNKHKGRRVQASGTTTLILTGKAIPEGSTSLTDINSYRQVSFEAFLNYINADGYPTSWGATDATTGPTPGSGTWMQVRDLESYALGYKGITNRVAFPVASGVSSLYTVKGSTYDMLVIEHNIPYISADNTYTKKTPVKTILAMHVSAAQNSKLQTNLNAWLLTTPTMNVPADWTT